MFLIACGGSYSKRCWDDVCKILENGVTRYEGDPEKIKIIQEREQEMIRRLQARDAAMAARDDAIKNLPKRKRGEVIRVGIIKPEASSGLGKYGDTFYHWVVTKLNQDPQIQVVPYSRIRGSLSAVKTTVPIARGWNQDGPREKRVVVPNAKTYKKLRNMGVDIDVLIYLSISPKTQSGLVGGKGQGVGVISASRIELSGVASSIYTFKAHRHSVIGKSSGRIDIAGIDRQGERSSATIQNKERNIKLDKPAAESFARYYASIIKSQIAPHLPSLQAYRELVNKH